MATSYTIYIKDQTGGGGSSHTKAKTTSEKASSKTSAEKFVAKYKGFESKLSEGKKMFSEAALMKLGWAGIALIAVKKTYDLAIKVADVIVPINAKKYGYYQHQINYENYKATINNITHPLSFVMNAYQYNLDAELSNARAEQEQLLTGSSIVNTYKRGF